MSDLQPHDDHDPEAYDAPTPGVDAPADPGPTLADFAQPALERPDLSEFAEEEAVAVAGPDLSDLAVEEPAVAGPDLSEFAVDDDAAPLPGLELFESAEEHDAAPLTGPELFDSAEEHDAAPLTGPEPFDPAEEDDPAPLTGPDLSEFAAPDEPAVVGPDLSEFVEEDEPAGPDLSEYGGAEDPAVSAGPDFSEYARVEPVAVDEAPAADEPEPEPEPEPAGPDLTAEAALEPEPDLSPPDLSAFEDDNPAAEVDVVDAREIVGPDLSAFEDAEGAPEEAADPVWSPLDADGAGAGAVPYDPPELPAEEWAPEEINASMGEWHPSLVESDSDDHAALPPPAGSDALSLEGGSARRRFSLRARSVNPRLLVLLGVVAVAGGAFAVMHRGSGDSASAPVAAATHPAPAAKTTARTQAAHHAAAPAAGWTRIAVPAGRFTVDMPAGFHQAVDGSLVTFTAPAGTRAYAVNGSATGGGAPSDAVRRLVQSYRHDYRLLELSTRTTGAGAVEIAARGVRRSSGVRERILAAAFRAPRSARGLLVVQSFSNDAAARQDRAGRAEFERVRRTVRLAG